MRRYVLIYIFLSTVYAVSLIGQHIPELINYSVEDYRASHQNWSLTYTKDNWMYSANSGGFLAFNGHQWSLYTLNNKKLIRSVHAVHDRIYSGGFEELGYWTRDACGQHIYTSLMHLVPKGALENEEIWHIISDAETIYFQSFAALLVYDGEKINQVQIPGNIMFLQIIEGELWLPVIDKGIYKWEDSEFRLVPGTQFFSDKIVTGVLSYNTNGKECKLISTQKEGLFVLEAKNLYKWDHTLRGQIESDQINKIYKLPSGDILVGTIRAGLFIFSNSGELKYKVNTTNGLQNNSILALMVDENKGVWMGLDKGISFLSLNEKLTLYHDNTGTMGTVYALAKTESQLYIGTNQGVYCHNRIENEEGFHLINGTQGQVWHLQTIGKDVWCGHNEGTFIIEGLKAHKISDITGGWCVEYVNGENNLLIQGNYTGLALFSKNQLGWRLLHRIEGYGMPVKKIIQHHPHQFWVTGPYTGLKLLTLDASFQRVIDVKDYPMTWGFENAHLPDINFWKGKIRIFDGKNHLNYDEQADKFVKDGFLESQRNDFLFRAINDTTFAKVYGDFAEIFRVKELTSGYQSDGVLLKKLNGKDVISDSFRVSFNLNKDYNTFTSFEDSSIGICTSNGYAILDKNLLFQNVQNPIVFYKAEVSGLKDCIPLKAKRHLVLDYHQRDIFVYYMDNNFLPPSNYYYRVSTLDSAWSKVNLPGIVRLVNLPIGQHVLEISEGGSISTLYITLLPPWYLSWWSIGLYLAIFFVIVHFVNSYISKQLSIQKQKLNEKNKQILKEKMIQLENERLIQENISKNKELAHSTMQLVKKNETLLEIKNELIDIRRKGDPTLTTKDFQLMLKQINDNLSVQEDENLFHSAFEEVHESFIKKLKSNYPELSKDDVLLATYLRMNLASKDIAPLFKISLRGLENKRYRLRKKMNLAGDLNLNEFFLNYD